MKQKNLSKVFIGGFLVLYVLIALISFIHAVAFFNIGNEPWMSVCLAAGFELGLALSLCAILLSDANKSKALPWALLTILTIVQVIGNVYSTFSHIAGSSVEYYQNLAKPLLFFLEEVSQDSVMIIISWIMGAILPIVALMMTDMIASNIKMQSDDTFVETPKQIVQEVKEPIKESVPEIKSEPKSQPKIIEPKIVDSSVLKVDKLKEVTPEIEIKTPSVEELEKQQDEIKPDSKKKILTTLKNLWNQQ